MDSSSRTLEIRVISGEDLRINRQNPVKKNAFVMVKTDSANTETTKMDTKNGSYPIWDEKISINMHRNSKSIYIEVQCKAYSGNVFVGAASIPSTDFTGGYIPANYLHFLSYRLRDRKGERNGIINLSVRVKGNDNFVPRSLRLNEVVQRNDGYTPPYLKTGMSNAGCEVPENSYLGQRAGVITGFPIRRTQNM